MQCLSGLNYNKVLNMIIIHELIGGGGSHVNIESPVQCLSGLNYNKVLNMIIIHELIGGGEESRQH